MEREYVVIGGGIYGSYVAWELAKNDADVVVLEKGHIGGQASGGPGKRGVRANGRNPDELPLMQMAYDIWPGLRNELGEAIGYERTGSLQLIERETPEINPTSLKSAHAQVWLQQQYDVQTRLLGRDEVQNTEPALDEDVIGAVYCPKDGVVDQLTATRAVAEAARREGAEIREETGIKDINQSENEITGVVTSKEDVIDVGEKLLLLTNSHASGFVEQKLDVTLPTWNFNPQVILTEPMDEVPFTHLIGHSHRLLAMKPLPGDRVMITGGWPAELENGEKNGDPIPEMVAKNIEQAASVFPFVDDLETEEVVANHLESCTIDHKPIIGRVPETGNLIIGTGWTGHGFAIAPAVSKLIAKWALTDQQPRLLRPFSIDRFYPEL